MSGRVKATAERRRRDGSVDEQQQLLGDNLRIPYRNLPEECRYVPAQRALMLICGRRDGSRAGTELARRVDERTPAEPWWNTRDPETVALAYTQDSVWRNRDHFATGRAEIAAFLRQKWQRELEYVLRKELWGFRGTDRRTVPVRVDRREASINDTRITETERRIRGSRPPEERGILLPLR